jgi:hypothetical protein
MDKPALLFGLWIGSVVGIIFVMLMISMTATNATGFGIECADKVLNNPKVRIDTIYTIHQQDTTVTYHFVKDR